MSTQVSRHGTALVFPRLVGSSVWVWFQLSGGLGKRHGNAGRGGHTAGSTKVGMLVDDLGEIPGVCMDRVEKANGMLDSQESYVEFVVKPETSFKDVSMLVILDPERLIRHLVKDKEKKPA